MNLLLVIRNDVKIIFIIVFLGPSSESYMQIETQILPSAKLISTGLENKSRITRDLERELEEMR